MIAECQHAECHYTESGIFINILCAITLNVAMLGVVMLSFMMSVVFLLQFCVSLC
jgi:hypothetical protein